MKNKKKKKKKNNNKNRNKNNKNKNKNYCYNIMKLSIIGINHINKKKKINNQKKIYMK